MDSAYSYVASWLLCLTPLWTPTLLYSFYNFDQILKKLHSEKPDLWQKEGRPVGMLGWKPKNHKGSIFDMNPGLLMMKWDFITPSWAKEDQSFLSLFRKMRLFALLWNAGLLVIIIIVSILLRLSN